MKGELWAGVCVAGMCSTLLEQPGWIKHQIRCYLTLWAEPDQSRDWPLHSPLKTDHHTSLDKPSRRDVSLKWARLKKSSYISCKENNIDSKLTQLSSSVIWSSYCTCRWNFAALGLQPTASKPESAARGLTNEGARAGMINRLSNLIAAAYIESLTEW